VRASSARLRRPKSGAYRKPIRFGMRQHGMRRERRPLGALGLRITADTAAPVPQADP
jgi:hypothetical protein